MEVTRAGRWEFARWSIILEHWIQVIDAIGGSLAERVWLKV